MPIWNPSKLFERAPYALLGATIAGCGGKSHADSPVAPSNSVAPKFAAADASAFFGSGSRLKAHVLDGGDGARALIDFYDSELSINCEFVENASGEYHCLPVESADSFFDADCTRPALTDTSAGSPPARPGVLVSSRSTNCDAMVWPYSLVEEQPVTELFITVQGQCIPVSVPPPTAWSVQPEPMRRFASAALSIIGEDGEAQALRATADDGAYVNLHALNQGQPCVGVDLAEQRRCVQTPIAHTTLAYYADYTCAGLALASTTLSVSDNCAGRSPTREVEFASCGKQGSLRELRELVPAPYQADGNGGCTFANIAGPVYRVGDRVSPSEAPALASTIVGSGSLTLRATANRLGTPLIESFRDWQLKSGEACALVRDTAGERRCAPGAALHPGTVDYRDGQCTQEVARISTCSGSPSYLIEVEPAANGEWTLLAAQVAEPYDGALFTKQGGACQPLAPSSTVRYFQGGAALDIDTFRTVSESTDP